MFTTASRAQRSTTFGAVLALFLGLLMFASPAQAAPSLDISASAPTITLGDSVTLTWTAAEVSIVTANGDWSGTKSETGGNESVTPTHLGANVFNLTSDDVDGRPGPTATVTVNVVAPAPDEVTPGDVTFPGECTVVVPATPGVKYTVTLDGETEDIPADTYDGTDFLGDEDTATFRAEALEGFVIAPGATVTWTYDAFADCFGEGDALVTAEASCSAVTFTNLIDEPVEVFYGGVDEEDLADGDVTIPAGGTRKISTSRDELLFVALSGDIEEPSGIQIDFIDVPQDCGADPDDSDPDVAWPIKHPTQAPAAGVVADGVVGQGGGPSLPAMALLSALALIAARRGYTLGR